MMNTEIPPIAIAYYFVSVILFAGIFEEGYREMAKASLNGAAFWYTVAVLFWPLTLLYRFGKALRR